MWLSFALRGLALAAPNRRRMAGMTMAAATRDAQLFVFSRGSHKSSGVRLLVIGCSISYYRVEKKNFPAVVFFFLGHVLHSSMGRVC